MEFGSYLFRFVVTRSTNSLVEIFFITSIKFVFSVIIIATNKI
jgi:hypothetical protein